MRARLATVHSASRAANAAPVQKKRSLSRTELAILGVLAILPLLSIALRILALPGVETHGLDGLVSIGSRLNGLLSLSEVPPDHRRNILYLLRIPTCAMLVGLVRLIFGLRVLGFRSILIAVAFHQSGIAISVMLIVLAIAVVLGLRPWLRHIELPYYARVSVVLCVLTSLMLGAIIIGPWIRSDIGWDMIAYPVIALGWLAESVARSVDRDNFVKAAGLAINTVLVAFLMTAVFWFQPLLGFLLRFPEIVLTQVVAIVMMTKFLDFGLLQHWDTRVMEVIGWSEKGRVAVIRNQLEPGIRSRRTLRSVQKIVDGLRESGYKVRVMEGDASLPRELRRFFPADPATGERDGAVLNLAQGGRGDAGSTHVPAMLEVLGVAYSGPTPLGHARTFDRIAAKVLLRQAGVPTPKFVMLPTRRPDLPELRYPVVVVPRYEDDSRPEIASDRKQLLAALKRLRRRGLDEAFVEEHVPGREIAVGLIGSDPIECLPLVELAKRGEKICPAPVDDRTARRLREHARAAFRACGCRDYARVDVRIGEGGDLWVLEVRTLGILAGQGTFVRAGAQAGYSFPELMARIVEVTRARALTERRVRAIQRVPDHDARPLAGSTDPVGSR